MLSLIIISARTQFIPTIHNEISRPVSSKMFRDFCLFLPSRSTVKSQHERRARARVHKRTQTHTHTHTLTDTQMPTLHIHTHTNTHKHNVMHTSTSKRACNKFPSEKTYPSFRFQQVAV